MAMASGASVVGTTSPRRAVTLNPRPRSAWAAVAPMHRMARGRTAAISACSHGEQARTSPAFGFWWMRFFPRGSHLKCLTALVT